MPKQKHMTKYVSAKPRPLNIRHLSLIYLLLLDCALEANAPDVLQAAPNLNSPVNRKIYDVDGAVIVTEGGGCKHQ